VRTRTRPEDDGRTIRFAHGELSNVEPLRLSDMVWPQYQALNI
jgi:hypothetical protein